MTTIYNVDGEQYRVVIRGQHAATFMDVEDACDAYADWACSSCWPSNRGRIVSAMACACCDVQTWRKEA